VTNRSINSRNAYYKIQREGLLSEMRLRAYIVLYNHGPGTANELALKLPPPAGGTRNERGNLHARFLELIEHGVATVIQTRKCRVTGHEVNEYDILEGKLPHKRTQVDKSMLSKTSRKALERLRDSLTDLFDRQAIVRTLELVEEADS
jgi:hypothetical protein